VAISLEPRDRVWRAALSDAQLSETLRLEATARPFASEAIASTAARHGAELLASGFDVKQVVHDYGDSCQAITEIVRSSEKRRSASKSSIR
jgi:hypothetical protein